MIGIINNILLCVMIGLGVTGVQPAHNLTVFYVWFVGLPCLFFWVDRVTVEAIKERKFVEKATSKPSRLTAEITSFVEVVILAAAGWYVMAALWAGAMMGCSHAAKQAALQNEKNHKRGEEG